MNGKFLGLLVALSILAGANAEATKARLLSLAQSPDGSLFIEDGRSIFLNPATIYLAKQSLNFELGNKDFTDANPDAEGGVLMTSAPLAYAIQLGRTGTSTDEMILENSLLGPAGFYFPQSAIDVVVGGGSGLRWGAGLHLARSERKTGAALDYPDREARDIALSGGVVAGQASGYVRYDLIHESITDTAAGQKIEYDGKFSIELGGKFDLDPNATHSVGAKIKRRNFDYTTAAGATSEITRQEVRADYFRKLLQRDTVFIFGMAGLSHTDRVQNPSAPGVQDEKTNSLGLPITIGIEGRALSWLSLRASVSQNFLIDRKKHTDGTDDLETFNEESTVVATGLTVDIGDFDLDATLQGADTGTGTINAVLLMANAALTYSF